MTGEDCSQPPLGVAETMLPNRSATSRWQVSPGPVARRGRAGRPDQFESGPLVRMVGSPVPGSSRGAGGSHVQARGHAPVVALPVTGR